MSQAVLKKIAEISGVSITTAHRALTGHPYVKAEVKKKVLKTAASFNYVPPQVAQKHQIAVLISANPEPYLSLYRSNILGMILAECGKRGLGVEAVISENLQVLDDHFLRYALICQSTFDVKLLKKYKNTAFFSMNSLHTQYPGTATDEIQTIRLGMDYLYNSGHRRIAAAVPMWENDPVIDLRLQTYYDFYREKNLDYRNVLRVMPQSCNYASWLEQLHSQDGTDAIFSMGEDILPAIYYGLNQHNIKIPEDLSLLSFVNEIACFLNPPITAVAQDFKTIINHTLDRIENALNQTAALDKTYELIPSSLVERTSVRQR